MRILFMFVSVLTTLAFVQQGAAQEKPAPKGGAKNAAEKPVAEKAAGDADLIRLSAEKYAQAYNSGDAKAIAAQFAVDAEYVDEAGRVTLGRDAIEADVAETIAGNPGSKLTIVIDSVRFVGSSVAIEDGTATITSPKGIANDTRYIAVHTKADGKWLLASVRDQAPVARNHDRELKTLDWLLGEWVDEGPEGVTHFTCHHAAKGKYLIRDFSVKIAGMPALTGTQRIGWDPLARKLRTWAFDSEGGFNEGEWSRDGESWVLTSHGVTADGEPSASTSIFTPVNDHTMTWQATEISVGGVRLPDTSKIRVVRRPPSPVKKTVK